MRFFAASSAGSVTQVVPFTTRAPEAPEIGKLTAVQTGPESRGPTHLAVGAYYQGEVPGGVEAGGADTKFSFEYSTEPGNPGSWKPASEGATGTVTAEQDFSNPEARFAGLSPGTTYSVRLKAENSVGHVERVESFATTPASPVADGVTVEDRAVDTAAVTASFRARGFEAPYRVEYAPAEAGGGAPPANSPSWVLAPGGSGTIPAVAESELFTAEERSRPTVVIPGLSPASVYYVRDFIENGHPPASMSAPTRFETLGPPQAVTFATHAIHGESMRALGSVRAHTEPVDELQTVAIGGKPTGGSFTLSFEGQSTGATASLALTSGSATVTPQAVADGTGNLEGGSKTVTGVRTATGAFHVGEVISGAHIFSGTTIAAVGAGTLTLSKVSDIFYSAVVSGVALTAYPPFLPGEVVSGSGIPAGATIVSFNGGALTLSAKATETATSTVTANLAYNASPHEIEEALLILPSIAGENVQVSNEVGRSYLIRFQGALAGKDVPQLTCAASALTPPPPSSTCNVSTLLNGHGYDTRYRFEYVTEEHFKTEGFANANMGPELDAGAGSVAQGIFATQVVGQDLPELQAAQSYRYRLLASTNLPGNPQAIGQQQVLTVPVPGEVEPGEGASQPTPCTNEALRSGPSARLPDCRSYEQVTPADKEGAQDLSPYGSKLEAVAVGEDGEHFFLHAPGVQWGPSPDAKVGEYYFARGDGGAWRMTSSRPVGETGPTSFQAALFSSDLTRVALEANWGSSLAGESPNLEFDLGAPGGPYTSAVTVPRKQEQVYSFQKGWVAASPDLSKLVLASGDRTLAGHATRTVQGEDLYEYTAGGLRQLNVSGGSPGTTIGTCGARIVEGAEAVLRPFHVGTAPHAVSTDGSRVFFEATPSSDCSEHAHLYMRTGGVETTDIGSYKFLAADREGTRLLLERPSGAADETVLYDINAHTATPIFTLGSGFTDDQLWVSEDFTAFYFTSSERLTPEAPAVNNHLGEDVYRYDLSTRALSFAYENTASGGEPSVSPDGRYFYTAYSEGGSGLSGVAGLPSGQQVYRYDSATRTVQCLSCASPYDPEPGLNSVFRAEPVTPGQGRVVPAITVAAANGDYVFFDTPAALVPSDIDGEVAPEGLGSGIYSLSSDVYEWRRDGLDGCSHIQGCLALISGGRGGYKTELLGTTPSGRDVFFTTHEALGPADRDTAGDVYDARIGGGQAPPAPRPIECEADACSTPPGAPNDQTPASSTFAGAGNLIPQPSAPVGPGARKKCAKGRRLVHGRCVKVKAKRRGPGRARAKRAGAHRKGGR
jgi:hypothetical protein